MIEDKNKKVNPLFKFVVERVDQDDLVVVANDYTVEAGYNSAAYVTFYLTDEFDKYSSSHIYSTSLGYKFNIERKEKVDENTPSGVVRE